MSFTPQELHLLRLADAAIERTEIRRTNRPTKFCQPPTGDPRKDARRIYRREWMRNYRKNLKNQQGHDR